MLYPKNKKQTLEDELFRAPTSEYRGTPFWAWNAHPEKDELRRQIEIFRQMGFGGFHMHVRSGMDQEYLSDSFFDCIRTCVGEAKEKQMLAWLYDEDRWPSGAVGGLLTKDPANRQHFLLFTCTPYCGKTYKRPLTASGSNWAERTENGELLACYDVELDQDGCLKSYRRIGEDEAAEGKKWYAYVETPSPNPWYNGQTYADLLNPRVTEQFVNMTHAKYKEELGGSFDNSVVPAIFTDEPQMAQKRPLPEAFAEDAEAVLPWSEGMERDFLATEGVDMLDCMPELFWNLAENRPSQLRWRFHNYITERFVRSFADVCGAWCEENGLPLTGHVMREPTLASQTGATGETMRSYRSFTIPGIDMLQNSYEYTTAKQAQSAVRQYGREGMTSELYGCTGWNYDFAGYKRQGDWQAALGVTVRVPHLSFLSMRGEAKRDYPASISYQSPWWKDFAHVEDHFARLATALTRGKALSRIAVIHPIESYWLCYGPEKESAEGKAKLDEAFGNLTDWLIFGGLDFDFISEALLPSLCDKGSAPLQVGKMQYDAVIVPPVLTLRDSTVERLRDFAKAGGKLIFTSEPPPYLNALPSFAIGEVYQDATVVPFEKEALLKELEELREIWITEQNAGRSNDLLFNLRADEDCRWLFLAQGRKDRYAGEKLFGITLKGLYTAEEYDTASGEHFPMNVTHSGGNTHFLRSMSDCDSLLLCLRPVKEAKKTLLDTSFAYATDEPNVLLMDAAEYALDGEDYHEKTELLRADNLCRAQLGFLSRESAIVQPWVVGKETMTHRIRLRFTIHSEIEGICPKLAAELTEDSVLAWNGESVPMSFDGWYVDKAIVTLPLPALKKGDNILVVDMPFGKTSNTEWFYLLGEFGVRVEGDTSVIIAKPETLTCGDLAEQGYPFFGGKLCYTTKIQTKGADATLVFPSFGGTFVKAFVDGVEQGIAAYPPHRVALKNMTAGTHTLTMELCLPRTNSFGPVHFTSGAGSNLSPNTYRTTGETWTDAYALEKQGILEAPVIEE